MTKMRAVASALSIALAGTSAANVGVSAFTGPAAASSRIALVTSANVGVSAFTGPAVASSRAQGVVFRGRANKTPMMSSRRIRTNTSLQMGYQLPPSGPRGPLDELKSALPAIGSAVLLALFFASPLGGLFFGIVNSFFVLSLLTPVVLVAVFQIWRSLNTISGSCPSCGAPMTVLKNGEPSICLNCGSMSRSSADNSGLELCNNPNDILNQGSLFDSFFGGGMGVDSPMTDVFSDAPTSSSSSGSEDKVKQAKRQGTIIDVDVERE